MQTVLVVIHLIICIALILIVLLQTGKGSEIGAVFGSSSQTLFGSTGGSTFFGKLTAGVAIVFMITSLVLAGRSSRVTGESVMSGVKPAATAPAATEIPSGSSAVGKETQTRPKGETRAAQPAKSPAAQKQPAASGAEKTK
jgi:preprotein translocase subunit SecG